MTIHYKLYPNRLSKAPNAHRAVVQPTHTVELEAVMHRMLERGSTITLADILSVLENYYDAITELLVEGYNVNTPGTCFRTSIKGVFRGESDRYDPQRHQIGATATPGKRIRKALRIRGKPRRRTAWLPKPEPHTYIDVISQIQNSSITPGGIARIEGSRLKLDIADEAQGIFFVAEDRTATRVDVLAENRPSRLTFGVPPSLVPGIYTLEVRTIIRHTKEVRTGFLQEKLTVSPSASVTP